MANQRREGQTYVGFQADERLVEMVDRVRVKERMDRSLFFRTAIAEKLARMGFPIPDDWILPPMRDVKEIAVLNEAVTDMRLPEPMPVTYSAPKRGRGRPRKGVNPSDQRPVCVLPVSPEVCPINQQPPR